MLMISHVMCWSQQNSVIFTELCNDIECVCVCSHDNFLTGVYVSAHKVGVLPELVENAH